MTDNEITIGTTVKIVSLGFCPDNSLLGKIGTVIDIKDFDELGIGYKLDINAGNYSLSADNFIPVS